MNSEIYRVDNCHIVNFHNIGAVPYYSNFNPGKFVCPAGVILEFERTFADALHAYEAAGWLARTSVDIDAVDLANFVSNENLGLGESSAILECLRGGGHFVCDDRKARGVGTRLLGPDRVTGSIGLLKQLVGLGSISAAEACEFNMMIRETGGFVPMMDLGYWDEA